MNFTKEYIELCKNEKVQELRPELECDDKILWHDQIETVYYKVITPNPSDWLRRYAVWLPTGEQLDDEIVKICIRKMAVVYVFVYRHGTFYAEIQDGSIIENQVRNSNPLIAKIKLLLQLLEAKE